jgi:hypothetical protein
MTGLKTAVAARKLSAASDGLTEVSAQLLSRLAYEATDRNPLRTRARMRREELTYAARTGRRGGRSGTGEHTRGDQCRAAHRESFVPHDTPLGCGDHLPQDLFRQACLGGDGDATKAAPNVPAKSWPNAITKAPVRLPGQTTKKSPNK